MSTILSFRIHYSIDLKWPARATTPARGRRSPAKADSRGRGGSGAEARDSFKLSWSSGAFRAAKTIVALAVHMGACGVHPGRRDVKMKGNEMLTYLVEHQYLPWCSPP